VRCKRLKASYLLPYLIFSTRAVSVLHRAGNAKTRLWSIATTRVLRPARPRSPCAHNGPSRGESTRSRGHGEPLDPEHSDSLPCRIGPLGERSLSHQIHRHDLSANALDSPTGLWPGFFRVFSHLDRITGSSFNTFNIFPGMARHVAYPPTEVKGRATASGRAGTRHGALAGYRRRT